FAAYPHQVEPAGRCFNPGKHMRGKPATPRVPFTTVLELPVQAANGFPRDFSEGPIYLQFLLDFFSRGQRFVTRTALGLDGGPKGKRIKEGAIWPAGTTMRTSFSSEPCCLAGNDVR